MTAYNLLMLSGDVSVAQGRDGAFAHTLRRFSRHWARIDVLTPRASGAAERTLFGSVHVHPSPLPKWQHPRYIRERGAALMAERPYALITSQDSGLFYNGVGAYWLSRASGVPYVSELHHVEGYPIAVTARERLYRLLAQRYIPFAARHAAAFRVVNNGDVPALLRRLGVPEDKILVLPALYLDFDLFHPMPDEPRHYDVLFVGRLVANKGVSTLLRAIARVRLTHPNVRLAILGRGKLRSALEREAAALDINANVTWLDPIAPSDLARLYNQSAMLVCASTVEGGPRVTAEAMASGVPVVTTPVGIMPELIRDGENGLLFRWDADALAAHICRLLDDDALRQRLGAAGRATVARFAADAVIASYASGYHDLIRRLHQNAAQS